MKNRFTLLFFSMVMILSLALSACGTKTTPTPVATASPTPEPTAAATATSAANPTIILATTSSSQDSELLAALIPAFEKKTGFTVRVMALGSGEDFKLGQQGNVDVLLVHSPSTEATFMSAGYGSDRRLVMHNDLVIVGPAADPAGIATATSAVAAFQKIAATGARFVSRGDQSSINTTELNLWKSTTLNPIGTTAAWYTKTGQSMLPTLTTASERGAYTLTDRITFLANKTDLKLEILYQGDNALLLNVYHVIIVNHEKWPVVNLAGATAFADYLVSPEGQALIGSIGVDEYGQPLFLPDAGKTDAELGLQ